jgi:hypothetical protein
MSTKPVLPSRKPSLEALGPARAPRLRPGPQIARSQLYGLRKAPDPTDPSKYPKAIDEAAKVELTQVQKGFRERLKAEMERSDKMTAAFYYTVLVFETQEQCDTFIRESGCAGRGSDLFIDGRVLADALKIRLPDAGKMVYNVGPTKRSSWSDLV